MKNIFLLALLMTSLQANAATEAKGQWKDTTLSEATIKNIQQAKYKYLQCITGEVNKKLHAKKDARAATDQILKVCEKPLANIGEVFAQEKVPSHISTRYIKSTRTQTARKVLQQLMIEAAKR